MTDVRISLRHVDDLTPDPLNARTHSVDQIKQLEGAIEEFGWTAPILADDLIRAGHGRRMAAIEIYGRGGTIYLAPGKAGGGAPLPAGMVPVIDCTGWTEEQRKAYSLADNQLALQAGWNTEILFGQIEELKAADFNLDIVGFDQAALDALVESGTEVEGAPAGKKSGGGSLAGEFLIPPFTVMNAREGWWMDRKRAWLSLGIKSEVGRGENLIGRSLHEQVALALSGKGGKGGTGASYDAAKKYIDERRAKGVPDPDILREAQGGKANTHGRTFGQDFLRGEPGSIPLDRAGQATKERAAGRKQGLGGVTMDALSSHPRYYEQKTAAEAKVGRKLTPEEFERDHWVLPDSELSSGTSIFDPVLCELSYRWFSPPGGRILDPFAGGSVRGIVAAALGRNYVGIDLRPEQIEANREQWPAVRDQLGSPPPAHDGPEVPPIRIDEIEGIRVVRDDQVLGGTKRRVLDRVVAGIEAEELVYATPAYGFAQIALAGACRAAGKRATIFVAARQERHARTAAAASLGADVIEVKAGRLNVIQSRARKHCEATGAYQVPFGMDDDLFVAVMAEIIAEGTPGPAPEEVWCVAGSGVLTRALQRAFPDAVHHAVQIGRDPNVGNAKLWVAPEAFEEDATDPPPFPSCSNYDAKAWRFIREHAAPGALFWNLGADIEPAAAHDLGEPQWHVGDSKELLSARHEPEDDIIGEGYDMIFSCPPYGDLEVYSDDPKDISTLEMSEFDAAYQSIIQRAAARLADNRFAVFVVGDYRDKRGIYANFVSKTIAAFESAGMALYNEAILITSVGSLPIRTAKQFRSTRKLGKTHQNVLVFIKGNPRQAVEALGAVDVGAGMDRLLEELAGQPDED